MFSYIDIENLLKSYDLLRSNTIMSRINRSFFSMLLPITFYQAFLYFFIKKFTSVDISSVSLSFCSLIRKKSFTNMQQKNIKAFGIAFLSIITFVCIGLSLFAFNNRFVIRGYSNWIWSPSTFNSTFDAYIYLFVTMFIGFISAVFSINLITVFFCLEVDGDDMKSRWTKKNLIILYL